MPIKSEVNPFWDLFEDVPSSLLDNVEVNTEMLSDDIWKKFELDFPEFNCFDDMLNELDASEQENILFPMLDSEHKINHDCMWAGHCGSKEHPADELRLQNTLCLVTPAPATIKAPAVVKPQMSIKQPATTQQQSVLKPAIRAQAIKAPMPLTHTPQTPPMSDDEETKLPKTIKIEQESEEESKASPNVLDILRDAIEDCDIPDEDSDLCDYFEGEDLTAPEVDEEKEYKANLRSYQFAAESDHSYHKDKNASHAMRKPNYGIETPSDSEEEIDVVSIVDKMTVSRMGCSSLPTNPSTRDRQQLQRRMATAISKKRISNCIKTIYPLKKSVVLPENTTAKRKMAETRGVKRKQFRMPPAATYKRRVVYGNSSDSEPEPSEKRSLHNNMERQRRIDLRNAFEDLRLLVPEVSKKERAAKVVILREAAQYCDNLGMASQSYTRQLDDLRKQQERLRQKVSLLRRNLASKR